MVRWNRVSCSSSVVPFTYWNRRGNSPNLHSNGIAFFRHSSIHRYEGEFVDHQRDGQGTYMFADGEKYEGSWKDDKRNGSGTYTFANGGEYEGMWKDGIFNGIGTLWRQDGYYYHGEWRAGMRHGIGHETCPNDKTGHVGHWINDEPVRGAALKNKVVSKKRTVTKKKTTTKKKKKTAKQNSTKSASVLINFSSLSINEKDAFEQPMNF